MISWLFIKTPFKKAKPFRKGWPFRKGKALPERPSSY
jgi:hypothetical protein